VINNYEFIVAHPETFRMLSVKDMLFVHYICPQVDKQIISWTQFNIIALTLNGIKTYHHGGKSWTLTDDSLLFLKKGAYTQEKYEFAGWEVMAFYLRDDFLKQVFNEYRNLLPLNDLPRCPEDVFIDIKVNDRMRAFFYGMLEYFKQSRPPPEDLLEMKFRELLFIIFSDPANKGFLAYVNTIIDQYKIPLWQIMESNYMFHLTIPEYALMAQRSVSVFKREFHDTYHTTPGRWLTMKRLAHAKLLLDTSRKAVSEIAYESGFENISHFSRAFKDKYGIPPVQYRRAAQLSLTA
jgi:AraC-like DNA-binding protein